jgi:molecular chaperone DnaK
LQKVAKVIDEIENKNEWPNLEIELKKEFYRLEKANSDFGNDKTTQITNQVKVQLEEVIKKQDVKLGNALLEEITTLFFKLTLVYQLIGFIRSHNEDFESIRWKDKNQARTLLNRGLQKIGENPNSDDLHPIVISLIDLIIDGDPNTSCPSCGKAGCNNRCLVEG